MLDSALAIYALRVVVVGHTIVPQITKLVEGRVVGIDATFKTPETAQALLIEKWIFYRGDAMGRRTPL